MLPNTSSPSSNSNSLTSTHQIGYWKASSQLPITSNTLPQIHSHRARIRNFFIQFWKYAMWPLALILVCIMVAAVVYFLLSQNDLGDHHSALHSQNQYDDERNAINFINSYNSVSRNNNNNNQSNASNRLNQTKQMHAPSYFDDRRIISNPKSPSILSTLPSIIRISTTTARTVSAKSPQTKILLPIASTTTSTIFETTTNKVFRVYANSGDRRKLPQPAPKHTTLLLPHEDDVEDNIVDRSKLLFPSKETLENFGFTSGHQNNFGVPIEEDERLLRMLNDQMLNSQRKQNQSDDFLISSSITTDANVYQTKVSPTLPNLKKSFSTTERIHAANVTTDDGKFIFCLFFFFSSFSIVHKCQYKFAIQFDFSISGICQSTTIPLCRGILPYDLTNVKMVKSLTPQDLEHFQYLIESKCSMRTHEFVCSILEPECRPERMGPLLPCKRICKCE